MKMNNTIKLDVNFDNLQNPQTIIKEMEDLMNVSEATSHRNILTQLLDNIKPVDFQAIAFPNIEEIRNQLATATEISMSFANSDQSNSTEAKEATEEMKRLNKELAKMKLSKNHYLIISIENALQVAKNQNWGLCKNHDFIYLYNGTHWSEIEKETFQKFLGESSEKMGVTKFQARFHLFREQLFKQFLATAYLPKPEVKKETVMINLQNGTFEVKNNGKTHLRPFDQEDFITYQLPFKYDPEAKAPLFTKFLNRVLPDPDSQKVLAEYLGNIFIKHGSKTLKEEKALILYGSGANGKSVFFDVVTAMFGSENVSNYSLQSLTEEKGFYRARIANKLVNYASEISTKLEASLFKQMVTGEPVEACLKYGQPFTMTDYAKFIFNCNELPKDVEHTNAYFRRFLIIPFEVTIPSNEQDKRLSYKIIENELSGVFNWVLDGLHRLLKQSHFTECEAVQRAVEQYKIESNSVQMFLNDAGYSKSTTETKLIKDVFQDYKNYCFEDGMPFFKKLNFIKQLRSLGYVVDRVTDNKLAVFLES